MELFKRVTGDLTFEVDGSGLIKKKKIRSVLSRMYFKGSEALKKICA